MKQKKLKIRLIRQVQKPQMQLKLKQQLQAAGQQLFEDWQSRAGDQAKQLVERYRERQAQQDQ